MTDYHFSLTDAFTLIRAFPEDPFADGEALDVWLQAAESVLDDASDPIEVVGGLALFGRLLIRISATAAGRAPEEYVTEVWAALQRVADRIAEERDDEDGGEA